MEEITPDLISRIASRIYNEGLHVRSDSPQQAGSHGMEGMAPPDLSAAHSPESVMSHVPVQHPSPDSSLSVGPQMANLPYHAHAPHMPTPTSTGFGESYLSRLMESSKHGSAVERSVQNSEPGNGVTGERSLGLDSATTSGLKAFVAGLRGNTGSSQPGHNVAEAAKPKRMSFAVPKPMAAPSTPRPLDVQAIRKDFPILRQTVHGKPLIWLDNAATTQKPQCVIDAVSQFYENDNSNIHRGAHTLAARATDAYEGARKKVQNFLGAGSVEEIVFVRGTTEGINLITQTYGRKFLQPGDEIVLSTLEHHANIVPWQMIAKEKGAVLRVIPVNDHGEIMLEEYQRILGPRTKVVALTHASNSLGTILPVAEMTQMAKRFGARVLIDGAQSVAHIPVNMQQLGCDFFVFSGHKVFGPSGIGAVYISKELHDVIPPWQGGGNMIRNVTFEETTFSDAPAKFEAGTPNIADAVGLGAAIDYVQRLGLANIGAYEHSLLLYATDLLTQIPGLRLLGTAREKVGVLSFVLPNRRTEDVGRMLDMEGIAVRSGHHCSQPSLRRFGVESTVRPSLSLYNTRGEIDRLASAVDRIAKSL